jgi:3'-5' exoribonuclease
MGHIAIADEMIVSACIKLGIPTTKGDILNMRHCILSHHGRKEWGSPVVPATREAILIHQLDMIQSRGQMALEGTEALEPGKMSSQHKQLEAYLYKPI